ncbi:MAG: SGNH/GDSL hydrolase family protein [Fimbriimonadaceae bacterium]|nr:SGNH/GDSL hydrolase family protein [Fimbriimonadaceae bacterium]
MPPAARAKTWAARLLTLAGGLLAGLLLLEGLLRLTYPSDETWGPWRPWSRHMLLHDQSVFPQLGPSARFVVGRYGVRSPDPTPPQTYRLLCIGGSTTECLALDTADAWPARLQDLLTADGPPTWVANAGRSALDSRHHLVTLTHLTPQLPNIDAVLILVGVNDLLRPLARQQQWRPQTPAEALGDARVQAAAARWHPGRWQDEAWFRQTALARLRRDLLASQCPWVTGQPRSREALAAAVLRVRSARRQHTAVATLPPPEPALRQYAAMLDALIAEAKRQRRRLVLATQPTIWSQWRRPEVANTLVAGALGADPFEGRHCAPAALDQGMAKFNAVLRQVCGHRQTECLDLARQLEPLPRYYYDDFHFTPAGAARVAELVAAHFRQRPPYTKER